MVTDGDNNNTVSIILTTPNAAIVSYVLGHYDGTHITIDSDNKLTGIEMIGGRKMVEKLGKDVSYQFQGKSINLKYIELTLDYEGEYEFMNGIKVRQSYYSQGSGRARAA